MDLIDKLIPLGLDAQDGLTRFLNNRSLFCRMLAKLPAAVEQNDALTALRAANASGTEEDAKAAFEKAHSLKGVCGNLSVKPLYEGYSEICTALRASDVPAALAKMEEIAPVQKTIVSAIVEG